MQQITAVTERQFYGAFEHKPHFFSNVLDLSIAARSGLERE
jgi:hypothetical protein